MLFFCLYKQLNVKNKFSIQNTSFNNYEEYNSFVTNNAKYIVWAKLIDSETGEVFDSFTNLNYIRIEDFNVNLNPEDLIYFNDSGLCLKREFKNLINLALKHKDIIEDNLLKIPYIELKKEDNEDFFIPDDILLVNKPMLETIIKKLQFSLPEEELHELYKYKPNILNLQRT